jgi:hypothetical protein
VSIGQAASTHSSDTWRRAHDADRKPRDHRRPPGAPLRALVFTHVFGDRALGAQHAAGWEVYLDRLGDHLEGRFVSEEDGHAAFPEVHEQYAERFGLDPKVGRRAIAERQAQQR